VKLPLRRKCKFVDLQALDPIGQVYPLVLEYAQHLWPQLELIDDFSQDEGTPFWSGKSATTVSYVRKNGIRYGCTSNRRTQADSYAFIVKDGVRVPAEIHTLLVLHVTDEPPNVCALVRRFVSDGNIPEFPWDL
jgi:hypothetical protein